MKILLFLAKGFETMEASVFIDVMGWARNDYHHDVEVVTCGFQKTVISAFGVPVTVDLLLRDVCVDEYDALAIPGGFEEFGFYEEAFSKEFCDVIHKFNNQHKMIATVCVAALALAHSGILTGKKATTYHLNNGHRQKQLAEYGVEVVNEPVVKTDNIITSYCPQTAPEVAFVLLESLIGTEGMHIVKAAMGFASLCDMAVCKNQIPILEFDAEQSAVIMPGHHSDYHFPQKAVMLFMEPEIDDFVAQNKCEVVGKFESVTKNFYVYKTQINGIDIAFVQAPLGGAGAVMIMDQLIAGGVKEIIAAGCCGSLVEDTEGTFFVPTAALRQEGTSYHYLPSSREVELDAAPIEAICRVLEKAELSYRTCKTWTTDGFYRETKEMVLYRKSEGYSVVEMECASLAACAKMRGVLFGQVLFTADSLADVDAHDIRNWGNDFFAAAMKIAMEAITEV